MEVLIGYYQSWKTYTTCTIKDIDPRLYTHLIYAFAGVEDDRIRVNDKYGDIEAGGYKNFNALKKRNPNLRTLLAVGGWEEKSKPFSKMVRSAESRETFINSCLSVMKTYGFDGIDLDWEYPCLRDGVATDKKNFTKLVKEMSRKFQERYLLTVAVGAGKDIIKSSYDVPEISDYVDFIHLMTYDFHSSSDGTGRVGHNAPLYSKCGKNVYDAVRAWLNAGACSSKLVLGIPAYGRSFTLADKCKTYIGASSAGPGKVESVGYDEILKYQETGTWEVEWDKTQKVPYMYKKDQWIGYDDPHSIKKKVKLAYDYNLAGIMIYAIDTDDPKGNPSYPLTKAIRDCSNLSKL